MPDLCLKKCTSIVKTIVIRATPLVNCVVEFRCFCRKIITTIELKYVYYTIWSMIDDVHACGIVNEFTDSEKFLCIPFQLLLIIVNWKSG